MVKVETFDKTTKCPKMNFLPKKRKICQKLNHNKMMYLIKHTLTVQFLI